VEVEVETLRGSLNGSIAGDTTTDGDLEGLTSERAWKRTARWAVAHTHGDGLEVGAPNGGPMARAPGGGGLDGPANGAPGGSRTLGSRAPAGSGVAGYLDIQAVVRDAGPSGGWPILTNSNYVEWAAVMRVRLQVRHMWDAV